MRTSHETMAFELLEAYFSRNRRWLVPALCALTVAGASNVGRLLDPSMAQVIPEGLVTSVGALGCFGAGLGASFTNTASSRVVTYLGSALGVVIVAAWCFA